MREIKFDLVYKTKVSIRHKKYYLQELMRGIEKICDLYDCELLAKRQWTGLLDKNGEEIYEGDIVKDSSSRLMIVERDNRVGASRFIFRVINTIGHIKTGRFVNTHEWITSDDNDIKVIGNIYEHSHLLDNN